MANLFSPSLHGDGISFTFFQHLWNKTRNSEKESSKENFKISEEDDAWIHSNNKQQNEQHFAIRVPDTVIFQIGQPLQWYFTSERGGHATVLRKRRQNLNVEKIEEEFLKKAKVANKGLLGPQDIIAYFIASTDCTRRNRFESGNYEELSSEYDDKASHNITSDIADLDLINEDSERSTVCDVEYFNQEGLHEFLTQGRKKQTGILQRFIDPATIGTHNSQIRAICSKNVCLLERRRTKQDLHDIRFGIYERAVTFDGPECYSVPLPIRGTVLSGRLKHLCEKVLSHISEASRGDLRRKSNNGYDDDIKMVLHMKVDSKDRIWILYSSSIRSTPSTAKFHSHKCSPSDTTVITSDDHSHDPLNINDLVQFPPTIKLSLNPNHDPDTIITNEISFVTCPSCAKFEKYETFHPIPYKTIILHFEKVMSMMNKSSTDGTFSYADWPPSPDLVKKAGGVGFGILSLLQKDISNSQSASRNEEARDEERLLETLYSSDNHNQNVKQAQQTEEEMTIPPVLRYSYERLKVEGYRRYRTDPLFLHKECKVCEDCFLSYAKLSSTSFQITQPIKPRTEFSIPRLRKSMMDRKQFGDDNGISKSHNNYMSEKSSMSKMTITKRAIEKRNIHNPDKDEMENTIPNFSTSTTIDSLFQVGPSLPPAIFNIPPKLLLEKDENYDLKRVESTMKRQVLPLSYSVIESKNQPLMHLITMQQKLQKQNMKIEDQDANRNCKIVLRKQNKISTSGSPYESPIKLSKAVHRHKNSDQKGRRKTRLGIKDGNLHRDDMNKDRIEKENQDEAPSEDILRILSLSLMDSEGGAIN